VNRRGTINAPKSISAWAPPQTPLGELTALPRPPNWIKGALLLREGMRRGGKRRGKRVKEGEKGGEGKGEKGMGRDDLPYDLGDLEMTWLL